MRPLASFIVGAGAGLFVGAGLSWLVSLKFARRAILDQIGLASGKHGKNRAWRKQAAKALASDVFTARRPKIRAG